MAESKLKVSPLIAYYWSGKLEGMAMKAKFNAKERETLLSSADFLRRLARHCRELEGVLGGGRDAGEDSGSVSDGGEGLGRRGSGPEAGS